MAKSDIKLTIKSSKLKTTKKLKCIKNDDEITYVDGNVIVKIKVNKNIIITTKQDNVINQIKFEENKNTYVKTFILNNAINSGQIFTKKLLIKENSIEIFYQIDNDDCYFKLEFEGD